MPGFVIYDEGVPYKAYEDKALDAEIYRLIESDYVAGLVSATAVRLKLCGYYLYAAAAEAVLMSERRMSVAELYGILEKLFGKKYAAAKKCMDYATFDYGRCKEKFRGMKNVSEKAFGYMNEMEIVALIADETAATAAERLSLSIICH